MSKRRLLSILGLLTLWEIAALIVHKPFLFPYPFDVLRIMLSQLRNLLFYQSLAATICRMLKGLCMTVILSLILGICSGLSAKFEEYFSSIENVIKTIPNVSYIVVVLLWLKGERSVTVIAFLLLFPTVYSSVLLGMKQVPQEILEISALEDIPLSGRIFKVYWPYLLPYLLSSIKVGFGLGFKVSIMAEILGAVRVGVGREINVARGFMEMDVLFAWTIWIILISLIADRFFDRIIERVKRDGA